MNQHLERHSVDRMGWLRAAVLGANDGIVSTASLLIGVAASQAGRADIMVAGIAGLVAGAMSMAAGEYVSVSSQADTEKADLERERRELLASPLAERKELADIYVERGLDESLAQEVAEQLMAHDALGAHARDELGLSQTHAARPLQAALASALTFTVGAAIPLAIAIGNSHARLIYTVTLVSLVSLAAMGALAARVGGAPMWKGALRMLLWGALAMAATALVGTMFGAPA